MDFRKIPKQIQPYILQLTDDDVFLERYDTDEELNKLDRLKYDPFIQFNQLQLLLNEQLKFSNIQPKSKSRFVQVIQKLFHKSPSPYILFKPITLALWSYLYNIKSPLILEEGKITTVDIDLFFYLLETKNFGPLKTVLEKSSNFCFNKYKLTAVQMNEYLTKMIRISFRVLNMFPKLKVEGAKPAFNVDWLTSIATKAAQVSNYNIKDVYNKISVCQAYYLFAQFCREKGSESIYLRTEEEIMWEEDLRSTILIVERLIELKAIEQKDKQFYINLIHSVEEQEKKDGC